MTTEQMALEIKRLGAELAEMQDYASAAMGDAETDRKRLDVVQAERDELLALCERARHESARVHPDFMADLNAAMLKILVPLVQKPG